MVIRREKIMPKDKVNAFYGRLGDRIRERRVELGFSIRTVAEKAKLSVPFVCEVENGKRRIAIGRLNDLAHALDVSVGWLIGEIRD